MDRRWAIHDSMMAFRNDAYRWFPAAGAFDSFMSAAERAGTLRAVADHNWAAKAPEPFR
jgi:hypothetical protein